MQRNRRIEVAVTGISPMERDDAEQVSSLFRSVLLPLSYYNDAAKDCELAKYTPGRLIEMVTNDPDSIMVARDSGEVAGYCFSERNDGLIWLAWFGIHPGYRGRGIGGDLLQALDHRTLKAGSHKVWCDCRTNNAESKSVLLRHGFLPLCTAKNHWHGQDFILWEKVLA